jgi:NDP-sugar pyrophosphorylase family protein/tRNA A-37 threonylcarbamoyl transferase component Bud32
MSLKKCSVNAMVLAAGLGTRLRPVTEIMPKPLIPVCNRPMLDIIIENVKRAGIDKIAVNTHYLPEQIEQYVDSCPCKNDIKLYHESEILGTGGGPLNAKELLSENDFFLIHNSDILTDIDLSSLLQFHLNSDRKNTMALIDGPENKLRVTPDGVIHDILDSLGHWPENSRMFTYSGIMILHRDIFKYMPNKPENCSIIKAVLKMMAAEPGCTGGFFQEEAYWNDLGTLPQYFQAHVDVMLEHKVKLPCFDNAEPVTISKGSEIDDSVELGGFAAIGKNASISPRANLYNCIVMDSAIVSENDFHCNEVILKDFSVHRNFSELSRMKILSDVDFKKQRLSSLQEQGSARGFYRLTENNTSKVLMVSDGMDQDFERFIYLGRFLGKFDFPTPKIYSYEPEEFTISMEDLGNDTLYRLTNGNEKAEFTAVYYRKVIDSLIDFQLNGTELFKRNDAPILRNFDRSYLRWETKYFSDNLLKLYLDIPETELRNLESEFDKLAEMVDNQPKLFMHRDFQSQNILIHQDIPRFVDFQGARMGPVGYDIMSLINDPYMNLPLDLRRSLEKYFIENMKSRCPDLNDHDLELYLITAGMQRNMQALGAYGFLGLNIGKKQYLQYIPRSLELLADGLQRIQHSSNAKLFYYLNDMIEKIKKD